MIYINILIILSIIAITWIIAMFTYSSEDDWSDSKIFWVLIWILLPFILIYELIEKLYKNITNKNF